MSDHMRGKIRNHIANDCKPFLKEFGVKYAHDFYIYRGLKRRSVKTADIIQSRTNRKPRLVSTKLHNYLNKIGKELFGWNIRSEGVFTGGYSVAKDYGKMFIFIPVGKYKYVYIDDTRDIYGLYDNFNYWSNEDEPYYGPENGKEKEEELKEQIYHTYKNYYKTKGLLTKTDNTFESIFKCKEYLVINTDHVETLRNIIREILEI